MTFPDQERLGAWANLLQAGRVVQDLLEQRLEAEVHISLAEHEVLMRLSQAEDGRLRMNDVASLLLVSKSGVTRIVDRLERGGLVAREACATDRRVVYARITTDGRAALDRAFAVYLAGLEAGFSRHLADADVKSLRRGLRKLLEGNGAWGEERCSPKMTDLVERTG